MGHFLTFVHPSHLQLTWDSLSLSSPANIMSKPYLFLYNAGQVAGWSLLLVQASSHLLNQGLAGLYAHTSLTLQVFQTAAVLEILHAAVGLVRSPVMVTFQQVFSRVYVTWAILHLCPPSQDSVGFPLLLFAWTITEIIRYSMYAINLFSIPPHMAQIHLLYHRLSCRSHWRTPVFLFSHDLQWQEGPSLCPPSKCSQRHLLLPAGHPRHHASLHSPLPSHVPAYVCSKKESPGHLPQAGLVFMFCIASYTAFASSLDESSGNILYLFGESFADFNLSACHECQLSMWLMKYSIVAQKK